MKFNFFMRKSFLFECVGIGIFKGKKFKIFKLIFFFLNKFRDFAYLENTNLLLKQSPNQLNPCLP